MSLRPILNLGRRAGTRRAAGSLACPHRDPNGRLGGFSAETPAWAEARPLRPAGPVGSRGRHAPARTADRSSLPPPLPLQLLGYFTASLAFGTRQPRRDGAAPRPFPSRCSPKWANGPAALKEVGGRGAAAGEAPLPTELKGDAAKARGGERGTSPRLPQRPSPASAQPAGPRSRRPKFQGRGRAGRSEAGLCRFPGILPRPRLPPAPVRAL